MFYVYCNNDRWEEDTSDLEGVIVEASNYNAANFVLDRKMPGIFESPFWEPWTATWDFSEPEQTVFQALLHYWHVGHKKKVVVYHASGACTVLRVIKPKKSTFSFEIIDDGTVMYEEKPLC